jgi:predicted NAD/FAD-binding protein
LQERSDRRLKIAVIGSGISGLSAAWLLAQKHDVTLYEKDARLGGHSNTVDVETADGRVAIDTGFIVHNSVNYPNLVQLFQHLDVATKSSNMSFAVSVGDGAFEYAGNSLGSLFAQKRNLLRPRFWSMLNGIFRFYRQAPRDLTGLASSDMSLGAYLAEQNYSAAFQRDHLLPMAGAIWSSPPQALLDYPAASFISFCENHGLLKLRDRPVWRTIVGGSRAYVAKLAARLADRIRTKTKAVRIERKVGGVTVHAETGEAATYDHVVIATHADQALAMLGDPSAAEREALAAFRYARNDAVLHSDPALMPRRKAVWSSWNYLSDAGSDNALCVTYWMNELQALETRQDYFVTLNPTRAPRADLVHRTETYAHPVFDGNALKAQARLSALQGTRNTWFCGAYFGAGFHEDGLKSGLTAAETLGGVTRPWSTKSHNPAASESSGARTTP